MPDALSKIWDGLGISPVWAGLLTLAVLLGAYEAKQLFDLAVERKRGDRALRVEQYDFLSQYIEEQSEGLTIAYLKLFKERKGKESHGDAFATIVEAADQALMRPLRKHQAQLDEDTIAKIMAIHNILAQYYHPVSDEAVKQLKTRDSDFYALVDEARSMLKPDLILDRLQLVPKPSRSRWSKRS
jgi:hypothetical protein